MQNNIEDELFCLNFEMRILSDQALYNESERWVKGFTFKGTESAHLDRYNFACKFSSDKHVLDIACGSGYGDYLLIKEGKAKTVVGVDLDKNAIRYGNLRYTHKNVERIHANAIEFNYSRKFDLIISFETIEHIHDYIDFLTNLQKNLADNGLLIISTPISNQTNHKPDNPYHVVEWSFDDFQSLVSSCFSIKEIYLQDIIIEQEKQKPLTFINKIYNKFFPIKPNIHLSGINPYQNQFDMKKCASGYQILVLQKI